MNSIAELRKQQYEYHYRLYPYIKDWYRGPYTWLKATFYMELSALLVYFLLKTKIKPNALTVTYGFLGLIGGVLLAIGTKQTIIIAISIFFLKGILDWSDGHLARITGQASLTGTVLDPYASLLGNFGLQIGLGFYVAQRSGLPIFYYLIPLIPLFYAINPLSFTSSWLFNNWIKAGKIKEYKNAEYKESAQNKVLPARYRTIYKLISNFLDGRAKNVDFICLLLLIELHTTVFLTWIIFLMLLMKQFIIFVSSLYVVVKGDWIEQKLTEKTREDARVLKT